jgi:hypothetical protein
MEELQASAFSWNVLIRLQSVPTRSLCNICHSFRSIDAMKMKVKIIVAKEGTRISYNFIISISWVWIRLHSAEYRFIS